MDIKLKPYQWIALAFCLKFFSAFILALNLGLPDPEGYFIQHGGDAPVYTQVANQINQFFTYSFHMDENGNPIPYTARMPGYELILSPALLLFNMKIAFHLVVFVQLFMAACSVYCLAKMAQYLFPLNKYIFQGVFFLYGFNTYVNVFDLNILPESFAVSCLIIGCYFLFTAKSMTHMLLAGSLLAWMVFLRPYIAPFFLLLIVAGIWRAYKQIISYKLLCCFIIPFAIADGIWITRNYIAKKEFIPLVNDLYGDYRFGDAELALFELIQAWGGDLIWWNPKAEIKVFKPDSENGLTIKNTFESVDQLPAYIYTSAYNKDSLKRLQQFFYTYYTHKPLLSEMEIALNIRKIKVYKERFIIENPFEYYIYAPLILVKKFIFHSGTYNICHLAFSDQIVFQKIYKLSYTVLYWITIIFGFAGILFFAMHYKSLELILWAIVPFYIILLCPVTLRRISYNYFIMSYPVLTVFMMAMLEKLGSALKGNVFFCSSKEKTGS